MANRSDWMRAQDQVIMNRSTGMESDIKESPVPEATILTEKRGNVRWITLNRPESFNAISRELVDALGDALDEVAADQAIKSVVITGKGEAFCAGGDLKEILGSDGSLDQGNLLKFVQYAGTILNKIPALRKPVIAAINGTTIAGGLELALTCDIIIAAESARIGDGHSNYGLVPGGGGAARLLRAVGPIVSKYLAFTGDAVPARDLVPIGLVNEVVPDDQLLDRASELAERIANKSASGIALMKSLINQGVDQPLEEGLKAEHEALVQQVSGPDVQEGLTAFKERRKPIYITTS